MKQDRRDRTSGHVGPQKLFIGSKDSVDILGVSKRVLRLNETMGDSEIEAQLANPDLLKHLENKFVQSMSGVRSIRNIESVLGECISIKARHELDMINKTFTIYIEIDNNTLGMYKDILAERKQKAKQVEDTIRKMTAKAKKLGYYCDGYLSTYDACPNEDSVSMMLDTCMDNLLMHHKGNICRFEKGRLVIEDLRQYCKREGLNPNITYTIYGETKKCSLDKYIFNRSRKIIHVEFENMRKYSHWHGLNPNLYSIERVADKLRDRMTEADILSLLKEQKILDAIAEEKKRKSRGNTKTQAERDRENEENRRRLLKIDGEDLPNELAEFVTGIYGPIMQKCVDSDTKFFDYIELQFLVKKLDGFDAQRELIHKYKANFNKAVKQMIMESARFKAAGIPLNFLKSSAVLTRDCRLVYKVSLKTEEKLG